jgi:hypothetical protein
MIVIACLGQDSLILCFIAGSGSPLRISNNPGQYSLGSREGMIHCTGKRMKARGGEIR